MLQVRMREDLRLLRGAGLYLELRSETERHGIEVLMPGPALMVRRLSGPTTFLITDLHLTELAPERLPNIALVSRRAGAPPADGPAASLSR
jgi:hypothetical protein